MHTDSNSLPAPKANSAELEVFSAAAAKTAAEKITAKKAIYAKSA
jgi:hypothetical protein